MVLPIVEGSRLRGILEVFSSSPRAFSNEDVQTLQALGRKVSHTVQEAVEGAGTELEESVEPHQRKCGLADAPEALTFSLVKAWLENSWLGKLLARRLQEVPVRRRDYNRCIDAAVIALAILLGWMVGRVGWSMAVNRPDAQLSHHPGRGAGRSPGDDPISIICRSYYRSARGSADRADKAGGCHALVQVDRETEK